MKKNSLTTAVVAGLVGVAGFAGLANAVNLNPDGLGQVLLYPYYTVNKDQATLISVVNTAEIGKAVKVRFLEGYNSREVLDFNLFLSEYDMWTAVVSQVSEDGGAQINTADTSCVDYIPQWPYPFSSAAYTGGVAGPAGPSYGKDSGPQGIERTREGYLEMIQMGDIRPGSALERAITHKQGAGPDTGVPTCAGPVGDDVATAADLIAPTGGLFGAGGIVNVDVGTYFAYNAEAVDGFRESPLYTTPSSLLPTLQNASTPSVVATGIARSFLFTDGGNLQTIDYARGEDAVSAIFMADSIYNEYLVHAGLGAQSDWVVTFPTKRFYVDKILYPSAITSPFAESFLGGVSKVELTMKTWDHEEGSSDSQPPRCPSPPDDSCFLRAPYLNYEVNVITFVSETPTESAVLGSKLFKTVAPFGDTGGWARIELAAGDSGLHVLEGGVSPTNGAVDLPGLPAIGFYANNIINANAAPGKLANYSGVWRHRAHRSCEVVGSGEACS